MQPADGLVPLQLALQLQHPPALLAPRRFQLAPFTDTGLFVKFTFAQFRQDPVLLTLLLKTTEGLVDRFMFFDENRAQILTPFQRGKVIRSGGPGPPRGSREYPGVQPKQVTLPKPRATVNSEPEREFDARPLRLLKGERIRVKKGRVMHHAGPARIPGMRPDFNSFPSRNPGHACLRRAPLARQCGAVHHRGVRLTA